MIVTEFATILLVVLLAIYLFYSINREKKRDAKVLSDMKAIFFPNY